ncbi:DUF1990 domain-containing protein [Actinoplanes sp. NPDC051851]|uniref:DUF1990 family protein n=1 Tax=Actinoplanes sp. NPDC051851 TaxID=3154753 RepID=UPI003426804E
MSELTYPEVGGTLEAVPPHGYRHVERDVLLGAGADVFTRAAEALVTWGMHRGAGLCVPAGTPRAAAGLDVTLRAVVLRVPCRVVYTIDEPERRGFAYGTLDGHPECGEEAFLVETGAAGAVRFRIRAFSRPATLLARTGGALTRRVQELVTDRYVHALRAAARG